MGEGQYRSEPVTVRTNELVDYFLLLAITTTTNTSGIAAASATAGAISLLQRSTLYVGK